MMRCLVALLFCCLASAGDVAVGVFTLFRPTQLTVTPVLGALQVQAGNSLVAIQDNRRVTIDVSGAGLLVTSAGDSVVAREIAITGRDGSSAAFILAVPGKIERRFHGRLAIRAHGRILEAVVALDSEEAVASAVAAESQPGAALEALKAQAVATRSYYAAAHGRHERFQFCDTTHCQFLREAPAAASLFARAANETRGLVLTYADAVFPALFSAACGGRTRSLNNAALSAYPYFPVRCESCGRRSRRVEGHQLGLCQRGAAAMAADGASFRAILDHYYPASALAALHP